MAIFIRGKSHERYPQNYNFIKTTIEFDFARGGHECRQNPDAVPNVNTRFYRVSNYF